MKRVASIFLGAILVIGLCACTQKTPTWEEQYDLGVRYLSERNYEEAIIAFVAAIEIDHKNVDAYLSLADAYAATGDYKSAEKLFSRAYDSGLGGERC